MTNTCLFCGASCPISIEHIVPESLGNDDLILQNEVCGLCNNYFSKIENFVLHKTDIAFWRTFLGIRSKKGKLPSVDLSQPNKPKGIFPNRHSRHTDGVGFSSHEDGSCSVDITDDAIIREIISGERTQFYFVMTPDVLHQFGRFLCKIGVEMICSVDPKLARDAKFLGAVNYARNGSTTELWPIFWFSSGSIEDLRRIISDGLEQVDCFDYSLIEFNDTYILFRIRIGTNNWVVCLNDQWPTPHIKTAFPGSEIQMIWYPRDSFR